MVALTFYVQVQRELQDLLGHSVDAMSDFAETDADTEKEKVTLTFCVSL